MGPGDLQDVLGDLRHEEHADLLVGLGKSDDAAVYRVSDDVAIVETVDFFPPIVDDPYLFGAIAAANSMSDVYAMGGQVLFALNVAGFPRDLPKEIIAAVFRGGADKVREAGGIIAGGHTVVDAEPKYGLCVTGRVDPRRILIKGGLCAGQRVFLSKPLGTGLIATAAKNDKTDAATLDGAVASMLRLNRVAAEVAQQTAARGATDITGFGLLGHAGEMVEASDAGIEFRARDLPLLPGALALAEAGVFSGGMGRNRSHLDAAFAARGRFHVGPGVSESLVKLLCESETSGGLLFAVEAPRAEQVVEAFAKAGEAVWEVGTVTAEARLALV
jgi:selenide,water dikinase